jgi:hypothetical protein
MRASEWGIDLELRRHVKNTHIIVPRIRRHSAAQRDVTLSASPGIPVGGYEQQSKHSPTVEHPFGGLQTSSFVMADKESNETVSGARTALGVMATLGVMTGIWILLVGGTKAHEMIIGAASMALAAAFLYNAKQSDTLDLRFRAVDVTTGWRLPCYLVSDVWVVTKVLVLDLLQIKPAGSYCRVWGFRTSKNGPVLAARRALATAYTSATPNSIVVGVDYEQNRILIHQMRPSGLTAMQRELGATSFGQHGLAPHRGATKTKLSPKQGAKQ